ncbi:MmgE/PrpD family protein [Phytohabitans kaempferiae]|uniref:MmgE/PrpD family protein n=1 Tax=Phytohabitans kaempferiae TaxID=1620943 RepID=A0ABV6M7R6_9ACTN
MDPVAKLADFVVSTRDGIPDGPRAHANGLLLDAFGVMLLGSRQDSYAATASAFARMGLLAPGPATVFGTAPSPAGVFAATALNATAMHVSEMGEGVSRAVVHASNAVVPAAVAVAQRDGTDGASVLRALALGMETVIRFGLLLNRPAGATVEGDAAVAYKAGWWTPSALSGIGAATAVGVLRELSAERLVDAWTIALNCAPATTVPFVLSGASGKGVSMGAGCAGGAMAADLAAAGVGGDRDVGSWAALVSPAPNPDRLSDGLGETWELDYPLYKYIATVGPLHPAIECALAIVRRGRIDPADIASVEVHGYARTAQFLGVARPPTEEAAKTSLKHVVAVALATGDEGAFVSRAYEPAMREDPEIGRLADKVVAHVEPGFNREYPMLSARNRLVVTLTDGQVLREEVDRDRIPRYHRPARADLDAKFARIVTGDPDDARCAAVADTVWAAADQPFSRVVDAVSGLFAETFEGSRA